MSVIRFLSRRVLPAFLLLILVAGTAALLASWRPWDGGARAWQQLLATLPDDRLFEPRLTGLPFASWSPTRGAAIERAPVARALAAARLKEDVEHAPSSLTYRRAAIGQLAIGDAAGAASLLEEALRAGIDDADLRSDLSAAYLVRGEASGAMVDTVRALDSAQRATLADPDAARAWFNQGLALQRLGLTEDAREAWDRAVDEADRDWAAEARGRGDRVPKASTRAVTLARLEALYAAGDIQSLVEAAATDPDHLGELVERRILRAWGAATVAGDAGGARSAAAAATAVADAIFAATGDAQYRDVLFELLACPGQRCAKGWMQYVSALELMEAEDIPACAAASADADAAFGIALSAINASRGPLQTNLIRIEGRAADAMRRLDALRPYALARQYWTVAGRAHWQTGLLLSEGGSRGRALPMYETALDLLQRARSREGAAVVSALLADVHQLLDDPDRAWEYEFEALAGFQHARAFRHPTLLNSASRLADRYGLDAAAVAFRATIIREARTSRIPGRLANQLAEAAVILQKLGFAAQARQRLDEAATQTSAIDDRGARLMSHAIVQIARGKVFAESSPLAANDALQEAIDIYRQRGMVLARPELELDRGRALVRAGQIARAEAAFAEGIAAAEFDRHGVLSEIQRASVLAARWELYAWLVDLTLRRDEGEALALLHKARAVTLSERLARRGVPLAYTPEPGSVAVEYAVLPSGVYAWVTTPFGRRRFKLEESPEALSDAVDRYRTAIERREPPEALASQSRRLYDVLLTPIAAELRGARQLVVVPDGPLHDLPFAALQEPATGRFLIERAAIVVTPSIDLQAVRVDDAPAARDAPALVIGNPDRSRASQDRLPSLAAAEQEARTVAALYTPASLAIGDAATAHYFVDSASRAGVIHFAGHAVVSETNPERSRLLLTPSASDPAGVVSADDIERLRLDRTRLVVLSACDTARGRVARGEGVIGLVRSFLAAGVPSVVATLWAVDDRSTETLFTALHRAWTKGRPSAEALRDAQIAMISDGRFSPADWASAIVVGQSVMR